jgi:hypothetical protein
MDKKDEIIRTLRKKLRQLKKENDFYKTPLFFYGVIKGIQVKYNELLKPPVKEFSTTKEQKVSRFRIDLNEIVCIAAEGKMKWIYFSKPQTSYCGIKHISSKLHFYASFENFCKDFDAPKMHLCIVNRSFAVNPNYYVFNENKLELIEPFENFDKIKEISIPKKYISEFVERKEKFESLRSFQKIDFGGIYNFGIK